MVSLSVRAHGYKLLRTANTSTENGLPGVSDPYRIQCQDLLHYWANATSGNAIRASSLQVGYKIVCDLDSSGTDELYNRYITPEKMQIKRFTPYLRTNVRMPLSKQSIDYRTA